MSAPIEGWLEAAFMAGAALYSWNVYRKRRDRRVITPAVVLSLCAAIAILIATLR